MSKRVTRRMTLVSTLAAAGALIASMMAPSAASAAPDGPASPAARPQLLAVIDAGSSGTRLALYRAAPSGEVAVERLFSSSPNTAGLSSFVSDPEAAGPSAISPLLSQLDAYLAGTGAVAADVPVALLATAGMRQVRVEDRAAAVAIMGSARAAIADAGHPLRVGRIMPGVKESLFAWVDANVIAERFAPGESTVGIVEVGGASAQVAFETSGPAAPGAEVVRIAGEDFAVVAVSYLGLGGNMARDSMQEIADGGAACFPNNASGVDPESYLAGSALPVESDAASFESQACGNAYRQVLRSVGKTVAERAVRPWRLREIGGFAQTTFQGTGSIPFIYADFQIPAGGDDRAALRAALRSTCVGVDAWLSVVALLEGDRSVFAETLCSTGAYLDQLVFGRSGVGVTPEQFQARSATGAPAPAWTAGYATTILVP